MNTPEHPQRRTDSIDRMAAMHREQLSALIDGELPPDQARFLIRRLEHDQELAGCQERWQLMGDVLRGELAAVAPVDFAGRISAALAEGSPAAALRKAPTGRYWVGGGALAAALAVLALVPMLRTGSALAPAAQSPAVVQTSAAKEHAGDIPLAVAVEAEALPAVGLATPSQTAAANEPVKVVARQSRPLAASPVRNTEPVAAPAVASSPSLVAASPAVVAEPASPFALPGARPEARPWPRSTQQGDMRFNVRLPAVGPASRNPFDPEVAAERLHGLEPPVR